MAAESDEPFDRWHKRYPKPEKGDKACRCGTKRRPLYPTADHGRGQQWQARYTDPKGKPRRPMFDTWQAAREHLDEQRVAMRKDMWLDPDLGKKKLEFYANQMMERRRKKKKNDNTNNTYATHLRAHIIPFAGHRVAKTLKRRDTMYFVDYLLEKDGVESPAYVVNVFKTWRILMNYMIDEDVPLPANICKRIELPDVDARVVVPLTPEQVACLAAAMREVEPRFEILIWIAACAGLREGEAFGLKRTDVAWDQDLLYVVEQRQRAKAVRLKTAASRVTLPVDHFLITQLAMHIATIPQQEPVQPVTERRRERRGYIPPPDEGLIVTNRAGRPVQRNDFNLKFRAAAKLAGLPEKTRYHDLKHFYTSRLGASGQHDPKTVQALSRHAEFSETWDTYAHPPVAVEGVKVAVFTGLFTFAQAAIPVEVPAGQPVLVAG